MKQTCAPGRTWTTPGQAASKGDQQNKPASLQKKMHTAAHYYLPNYRKPTSQICTKNSYYIKERFIENGNKDILH